MVKLGNEKYSSFDDENFEKDEVDVAFDELCNKIASELLKQGEIVSVLNPDGIRKFSDVYNAVKSSLKNTGAKVTHGINEPMIGSGYIRIIGSKVVFSNTRMLAKYATLASNFEVYPRVDGKVCMAFTFDGLALIDRK